MVKHLALAALAIGICAACGGGSSARPSCSDTEPCGAGSYCAHTPDGNVCWPDTTAPAIGAASIECLSATCRRDSTVRVTATATDDSGAMGAVTVAFDDDPTHPLALQRGSGDTYSLDVPLADVPFPYFEHALWAKVTATDQAGNPSAEAPVSVPVVTRALWTKALKGAGDMSWALLTPAIRKSDAAVIVAGTDGTLHFVAKSGEDASPAVSIGSPTNSPPAIGSDGIWLATQDGKLHKRALADGAAIAMANCTASAPLVGPPAVLGGRAFAASTGTDVLVATTAGACNVSSLAGPFTTPPAVDATGHVFISSGPTLAKYTVAANSTVTAAWTGIPAPSVGDGSEPLGLDAENAAWSTATSGGIYRTSAAGVAGQALPSASSSSTGSIVLADGSAVLGDHSGVLRRYATAGSAPWQASGSLSGYPRIPLALGGSDPTLLVATSTGWAHAVRVADGVVAWSKKLSGQALQSPNIWTEPGARTSTAYLAGDDGTLYAIIVDGALDTSAPWPKAFHDPQNTSNAGTPF